MDVDLYDESYRQFCQMLPSGRARVLDVACGPGNVSRKLLQQRPELEVLGIDLAPQMLELAKKAVPAARFKVHDIRQLQALSAVFDGIICAFGIPYLTAAEVTAFCAACARCLNAEGVLYLSFSALPAEAAERPDCPDYLHFHEPAFVRECLHACGFGEIVEIPVPSPVGARLLTQDVIVMARDVSKVSQNKNLQAPASGALGLQIVLPTEQFLAFELYKTTLFEHIEAVFGWDEDFQQQRFQQYEASSLFWMQRGPQRLALVCYKVHADCLHVHLLLVFPNYQGQGLGEQTMHNIHALARQRGLTQVTLSSFRCNQGALRFYQRLGYVVTHTETDFYTLAYDIR